MTFESGCDITATMRPISWFNITEIKKHSRPYYSAFLESDPSIRIQYLQKAVEQGNSGATFLLGIEYINGKTLPKDSVQACKWLEVSAKEGGSEALGCGFSGGSPELNAEGKSLANKWLSNHPQFDKSYEN